MERLTSNVHRRCSLSLETSEMHHNAAVTDLGSRMQRAINPDALKIYNESEPVLVVLIHQTRYRDPVYSVVLHDKSKDDTLIDLI